MNGPIKIIFVCMGNICRSPAAEAVMNKLLALHNLSDQFVISSAGTSAYHEGELPDARMRAHAIKREVEIVGVSKRFFPNIDFDRWDYIMVMDNKNVDELLKHGPSAENRKKIKKLTEFCAIHKVDYVPDPYYGGHDGFELVLDIIQDACESFLVFLKNKHQL